MTVNLPEWVTVRREGKPMDSGKPGQARTVDEIAVELIADMRPDDRKDFTKSQLIVALESYATEYAEERVREVTKVERDKCAHYCAQRDALKGEFEKEKYRVGELTRELEDRVNEAVRKVIMCDEKNYMTGKIEGYKAGQIAMRERAARVADQLINDDHDCMEVPDAIRSLSIEKKP